MRAHELYEDITIGHAKRAWESLSNDAKTAINQWESVNWTGGALEKHFKANDEIAQEIQQAIQPAIQAISKPSIKLWRGEIKSDWDSSVKFLESWTSDRKVAEHFAGLRSASGKSLLLPEISDEEIQTALEKLKRHGFVTFRHQKFKLNKNFDWQKATGSIPFKGPLYDIYSRSGEYITDTDDPEYHWREDQAWARERNQKLLSKAILRHEDIDVNRIVWITNNLGSKEYIVRKAHNS